MRLISLSVRNFRIHRECSVDFHENLNVLGGPNEVGKSTLMEALHRAFFLRANVTGLTRRSMQSRGGGGNPEVTVRFEAEGDTWILKKVFAGQGGTTRLSTDDGISLHEDEAESRLAKLLGGEEALGGRQANQLDGKWGHLWVWQGNSGGDPAESLQAQASQLMQRLQSMGGAGLLVSDRDSRTADRISERYEALFTKGGGVRKGSELDVASKARAKAEEEAERCQAAVETLEGAAQSYERSGRRLEEAESSIQRLEAELKKVNADIKTAEALKRDLDAAQQQVVATQETLQAARDADKEIRDLRSQAKALENTLGSAARDLSARQKDLKEERQAHSTLKEELKDAAKATRAARAELDIARALQRYAERRAALSELESDHKKLQNLDEELKDVTRRLAELPPVDETSVDELREMDQTRVRIRDQMLAVSAEIEVIEATSGVLWNDEAVEPGEPRTISKEGKLTVGDEAQIRLRPGGGETLADKRSRLEESERELRRLLEECGCTSLDEAKDAFKARTKLEGRSEKLRSKREGLAGSDFEARLRIAREDFTAAVGALSRLGEDPPPVDVDLESLRDRVDSATEALETAEQSEEQASRKFEGAEQRVEEAEAQFEERKEAIDRQERDLDGLTTTIETLEGRDGDAAERAERIDELTTKEQEEAEQLKDLESTLSDLDPAQLEQDQQRLNRALETQRNEKTQADRDQAAAAAQLQSTGSRDPYADLKNANAELDSMRQREAAARMRADAAKLLHNLFLDEKKDLTRRLAAPLEEKVNHYLGAIFRDGSAITLDLDEGTFATPGLDRGERFEFHELSGGAKEQLAAAIRLAVAEVLAHDHGGALPLIFDDAFTNSDPERITGLMRALDSAANRGLQVVLLTCAPRDYAALGGKPIHLGPGAGLADET